MGKSVLVIDDESSVGTLLKINLRQKGFNVETAESGAEGILKAEKKHFDLIILDVALPGMDGIEICQTLKELDRYSVVPIVMISSRSDSVTMEKAKLAGAAEYMVKPFTFEDLIYRVEDLLARPYLF